jgi:hypothetical protein
VPLMRVAASNPTGSAPLSTMPSAAVDHHRTSTTTSTRWHRPPGKLTDRDSEQRGVPHAVATVAEQHQQRLMRRIRLIDRTTSFGQPERNTEPLQDRQQVALVHRKAGVGVASDGEHPVGRRRVANRQGRDAVIAVMTRGRSTTFQPSSSRWIAFFTRPRALLKMQRYSLRVSVPEMSFHATDLVRSNPDL